jgi:hypothetical protein
MAGRPPKPTALKLVRGNPGKRRLNMREPALPVGLPDPPTWLPAAVVPYYEEIGAEVVAMKVMTRADRVALAMFASVLKDAAYAMALGAPVHKEIHSEIRAYLTKFGLSPSDRVKVKTGEPEQKESSVARVLRQA